MKIIEMVKEKQVRKVPIGVLLNWYSEISQWQKVNSVLNVALQGFITNFLKAHGKQVEELMVELKEFNSIYFKTTPEGQYVMSPDNKPVFKETADQDEYAYKLKEKLDVLVETSI